MSFNIRKFPFRHAWPADLIDLFIAFTGLKQQAITDDTVCIFYPQGTVNIYNEQSLFIKLLATCKECFDPTQTFQHVLTSCKQTER